MEIELIKGNPYAIIKIVSTAKVEYQNVAPSVKELKDHLYYLVKSCLVDP